jgi:hypothetical protein
MGPIEPAWGASWVWGLGLIALTIAFHASGVVLLARGLQRAGHRGFHGRAFRHPVALPVALVGIVGLLLAVLHGLEAGLWAGAYLWLGAIDSEGNAMLYSVDSLTTRGSSGLALAPHWRMMGALEAADGMLLFGISTAFVFAVIQEIMLIVSRFEVPAPVRRKRKHEPDGDSDFD